MSNIENQEQLVSALNNLTVMELCNLIHKLEEEWGVKAEAPVVQQVGPQVVEAPKEAQTEFDVVLVGFPADKKIAIIKLVREILGLGLLESKGVVEGVLPKALKEGISKDDAEGIKTKLTEAGAVVEVR
jgi:large subunit ribosomal protein L7/L12